ncbi:mitochondrial genome maintenance MGM101-domain-containing protein [Rhodocollybia butyracea]|uniref:Mitochondrial genome maintenance protein MGM101 n=1 Tax=Rhodocollybia butyracea TaxID=206335 RepID=A0A9P5P321_9AGAR|nr:mitochondrial genome maintenance MGM101-domain-containing protein [Rhodocollybia butyracea]
MSFATRFLSTARVAVRTGSRSANLPSSLSRAYATIPAAVTPEVKNTTPEEFKVASENPPPSGISDPSNDGRTDWSKSYHGLSEQAFSTEISEVLMAPINPLDIEIKPDGLIYLPEIKYRRILNKAFGPGAWGLAPRTETNVGPRVVSREYALVCQGRLVAIARGEQEYFDPSGIPTATESCKSNALMRCCKDLGVASELWDPRFIREFKVKHCIEVFAEHLPTKKKKKLWRRRDQPKLAYPYQES